MTRAELFSQWTVGLVIAGIVVLLAAALLIAILVTARRISREARRALAAVEQIRARTDSIWALENTNREAARIAETARSIRAHGAAVAAALATGDEDHGSHVA